MFDLKAKKKFSLKILRHKDYAFFFLWIYKTIQYHHCELLKLMYYTNDFFKFNITDNEEQHKKMTYSKFAPFMHKKKVL